jgi:predicted nucleotidyltransferase
MILKLMFKMAFRNTRDYLMSFLRTREYLRRLKIAESFVEDVRKITPVIAWKVTGSTARRDFGFTSDLDIEILTAEEYPPNLIWMLKKLYFKKYGILICCVPQSLKDLQPLIANPEFKKFIEDYFEIKL